MATKITAENMRPLKEVLEVYLPAEGGVLVARGKNGEGKSTFLRAVQALQGDKKAQSSLATNDGGTGRVSMGNCTITLGKVNRRTGKAEIESIGSDVDLAGIVDPGIVDPIAADKRRIQAIFAIAGTEGPTGKDLQALIGNILFLPEFRWDRPLLDVAYDLRILCQEKARAAEKRADEIAGEVNALVPNLEDLKKPYKVPTPDELAAAITKSMNAHEALIKIKEKKRLGDEQAAKIAEAKATLAGMDKAGVSLFQLQEEINEVADQIKFTMSEVQKLLDQKRTLEERLNALHARKERQDSEDKLMSQLNSVIDSALELVTDADVAAVEKELQNVAAAKEELKATLAKATAMEKAKLLIDSGKQLEQTADILRKASTATIDEAMGRLVGKVFKAAKFTDGRLAVKTAKGVIPFSDLSDGERWTMTMDLAIEHVPNASLLIIPQIAWEGIDGDNRLEIARAAVKRRVLLMSAEATTEAGVEEGLTFELIQG